MGLTNRGRIVSFLSVCMLIAVPAMSQYEISWYTIDGGGGTSSGGPYVLTGVLVSRMRIGRAAVSMSS